MDINKALAELRAAFPRVRWVLRPTCVSAYRDDGNLLLLVAPQDDSWIANCATGWVSAQAPNPVSAVRAWLAAQPTAAFYPEPQNGKTVKVNGWVAVASDGEAAFCGTTRDGDNTRGLAVHRLERMTDIRVQDFCVLPAVIHVPLPVDPPMLVGEVPDV